MKIFLWNKFWFLLFLIRFRNNDQLNWNKYLEKQDFTSRNKKSLFVNQCVSKTLKTKYTSKKQSKAGIVIIEKSENDLEFL